MFPHRDLMIMKSILTTPLPQRLGKYIPSPLMNAKPPKTSLTKISLPERFARPTHRKHPPSSSSKRRTEGSALAKTIDMSMNTPSAMPIPSLSSRIWLTNYKMLKSSPNSMFVGDTTMYESKTAINGRQPSSPIRGCLNPLSCSLDSLPLPPPYNTS